MFSQSINKNESLKRKNADEEGDSIEAKIRKELKSFKQLDKRLLIEEDSWEHSDLFDFEPTEINKPLIDDLSYPPLKKDRPDIITRASKAYKMGQVAIQRPKMAFNIEQKIINQPYSKEVVEKWDSYLETLDILPNPEILKPDFVDHAAEIAEKIRYGLEPKYEHAWEVNHRFDPEIIFNLEKDKIDATVSPDKRVITYKGDVYHCKDANTAKSIYAMILTREKELIPRSIINNLKRYKYTTTYYRRWPRYFSDDRTAYEPAIETYTSNYANKPIRQQLVEVHKFLLGKKIKKFRLQDTSASYMYYARQQRTAASKYELVLPIDKRLLDKRKVLIISSEKNHYDSVITNLLARFTNTTFYYACKLYIYERDNVYKYGTNNLCYVPDSVWRGDLTRFTDIVIDVVDVIQQRNMAYGVYTSANTLVNTVLKKIKTYENANIPVFGRIGLHDNFPIIDDYKFNYMFHKASGFEIVFSAQYVKGTFFDTKQLYRMMAAKTLIERDRDFMNARGTGIYYYDPEYPVKDDPYSIVAQVPIIVSPIKRAKVCIYDGTRSKNKLIKKNDFSVLGMVSTKKDDNISIIADAMIKNDFDDRRVRDNLKETYPEISYNAVSKIAAYKSIVTYGLLDIRVLRCISMSSNAPMSEARLMASLGEENKEYISIFTKNAEGQYEYNFGLDDKTPETLLVYPGLENIREEYAFERDKEEDDYVDAIIENANYENALNDLIK